MTAQKALFAETPKDGKLVVRSRDIPKPGPGQVLIKVHAASLNPLDIFIWKFAPPIPGFPQEYPLILGTDASGVIEDIGEGVEQLKKGDRVLATVRPGSGNNSAAFQQFTIANTKEVSKIPANISFEQGATFPLCLATAAVGLYGPRAPGEGPSYVAPWFEGGLGKYSGEPIVIFAGSTTVGQFAIQCAKMSGFSPIITTASLHNAPLLQSIGATHVVDRSSKTVVSEITSYLKGSLPKMVLDMHSFPDTLAQAIELVAPGGVLVRHPRPFDGPSASSQGKHVYTIWGDFNEDKAELGKKLYENLEGLLEKGLLKPAPVEVLPDGLNGIPEGLNSLAKVSAKKLIGRPIDS